jgi:ribosome-binding protein aMBF1 (putative translation factor)
MKTINECVETIGWSLRYLAYRLACDDRTVRRWASGQNACPPEVIKWLNRLAKVHEKHPAPDGWRIHDRSTFNRKDSGDE